jgi:general secretion pathway protein D
MALQALCACGPGSLEQRTDEPQNAADVVRAADLTPRFPQNAGNVDSGPAPSKGFSFFGSAATASQSPMLTGSPNEAPEEGKDGFTLNFDNAPVANVAKAILGDILHVGYVIDPRVQGSITLSSGRPVARREMLFVLENALRANNLVMVRDASGYRIAPSTDGGVGWGDRADGAGGAEPGYGMTVIPLKYVSGATLLKLLEGFATKPGAVRTDATGNMLVVVGDGAERQSAIDTVRSFDVDWMAGQSVGIYPVQNSAPEPVVADLEKIMDSGEAGLGHGLVKFQPVTRQNAILVVASKPELLRRAAMWIQRLDSPNSASASVKVYKVRYGDAKQIAQLLNGIFVGGGGGNTIDSATNQIAPSSGAAPLSATERLTGGRPANGNTPGTGASSGTGAGAGSAAPAGSASPFGGPPTAALTAAFSTAAAGGQGLLSNVRISADDVNNSILIYANEENYRTIERTLIQLDRPRLQVAIDVTIAEVTLNDSLNYGVQFYLSNKYGSLINSVSGPPAATANISGGLNVIVGNNATPQFIISALHALTDVKILSNPSLVVVDNQQATLEVGDQVPISTGSATVLSASNTVVNTVDYKNTGIILNVQPRVNANGNVLLDIEQEISSVPPNSTTLTPTISQRKVKSEINVASGQMVLLAGLISETQSNSRSGVPVLDQLPYVGGAFGTTGKSNVRTELIIFIRPQIIRDGVDASRIAEELRSKMRGGKTPAINIPAALNVGAKGL